MSTSHFHHNYIYKISKTLVCVSLMHLYTTHIPPQSVSSELGFPSSQSLIPSHTHEGEIYLPLLHWCGLGTGGGGGEGGNEKARDLYTPSLSTEASLSLR